MVPLSCHNDNRSGDQKPSYKWHSTHTYTQKKEDERRKQTKCMNGKYVYEPRHNEQKNMH